MSKDKEKIIQLAERQRKRRAERDMWIEHLQTNASGNFRGNLYNVMKALEFAPPLQSIVAFESFSRKLMLAKPPPWEPSAKLRLWNDNDDVQLQRWLQSEGVPVQSVKTVADAVRAHAPKYDALLDYLDGLTWDKEPRIGTWLTTYLSVEDNEYTRAVGMKWLVSAVARAYKPGVQADHVLILEGEQGVRKSTATKVLAGAWHKDGLPDMQSKDAYIEIQGRWIVELAELTAIRRTKEWESVKAFITRTNDIYREPYGRHAVEQLRRCVFVATTNEERYLSDTTGNRRFWPVKVGKVDYEALERDRDQLWAEAVAKYKAKTKWWITDSETKLQRLATIEQEKRMEYDPWTALIATHLEANVPVTNRVLLAAVGIAVTDKQHGGDAKRMGRLMKRYGFTGRVDQSGGTRDLVWVPRDYPEEEYIKWNEDRVKKQRMVYEDESEATRTPRPAAKSKKTKTHRTPRAATRSGRKAGKK